MKFLFAAVLSCSVASLAHADDGGRYLTPLRLLAKNCGGCHNSADHPGALFLNEARLSEPATLDLMIRLLEKGSMPPEHARFRKTKEGREILAFLKSERSQLPPR